MKKPKIVFFDIECTWGLNADTGALLCCAIKTLGDKKAKCFNQWDYEGWEKDIFDDKQLVKAIYDELVDADALCGHYSSRFDLPYINSRLILHGYPPLPTIPHLDTWRIARYQMKLSRNSLNVLAEYLGVEMKMHIGKAAWADIMNRKKAACKKMTDYCKQDVEVLEQIYHKVLPMIKNIPNYDLFVSDKEHIACPRCGSFKMQSRGTYSTKTRTYRRYQCQSCNGWTKRSGVLVSAEMTGI